MRFAIVLHFLLLCLHSFAQQGSLDTLPEAVVSHTTYIQLVTVIGQRDGIFHKIPGSVAYIGPGRLKQAAPLTVNEMVRGIPGLHAVDEEGAGLRLNLSVRGLDPDRSRGLLVLEDGIPVALNPYGEPELYYTPAIDRMSGMEVLKGSGQLLYGPQTIGGVLNFITADPPEQASGSLRLTVGEGGFFSGLLQYGTTLGNAGLTVSYLRKQADQLGYVGFNIDELNLKSKIQLSQRSRLQLKAGVYREESDATYIGLTQTMFNRGGQDFVRMAPDDRLVINRYSGSILHEYKLSGRLKLSTVLFGYTTDRDWQRQDFTENPQAAGRTGIVWGDPAVPGGAVYMLSSNGHRNRHFEVAGLESRLHFQYSFMGQAHELDFGARVLHERAYEQRINGSRPDAASGALVEDEIRSGRALSAFVQNKFFSVGKFSLHAGARLEWYDYERHILRNKFGPEVVDTSLTASRFIAQVIPGIGFNYQIASHSTVFGGFHKGFAPPRTKDAITKAGEAIELDAEESRNYELGWRGRVDWLSAELTAFVMDFSNQIIPVSESSGGTGSGLVNGGRTLHRGLELGMELDLASLLNMPEYQFRWRASGSYLRATFHADRFLGDGAQRVNIAGNDTPYAPRLLLSSNLLFETSVGWGLSLDGSYTGAQCADELNTVVASANGRVGQIPAFFVANANTWWRIPGTKLRINLGVKNITNERYIVTRRPQGIRLGLPRFISGGVELRF